MDRILKELEKIKLNNQLRTIPDIEYKTDGKVVIKGKEYSNFASNDYLGISTKDSLRKEFLNTHDYLLSSASARLLTGTEGVYKKLEDKVAKMFNKEKALIFNTGYQANLGVISALIGKDDVIFSDKINHASIIDGMKLSNGNFYRYKHLDYNDLERLLNKYRNNYKRAIIVSESIFSMDGDIADISKLIELKKQYNCLLMIDEAHAFCASGESLSGISNGNDVDIITATFGKAVGSFGAFCAADDNIITYLTNKSRSFIFSTSIPPLNIAWTLWLLTEKEYYIQNQKLVLEKLVSDVHTYMNCKGMSTISNTHIIPVITGSNDNTLKISEELLSKGYYIPAIRPPTVPEGSSRLRISLTADCHFEKIKNVLDICDKFCR